MEDKKMAVEKEIKPVEDNTRKSSKYPASRLAGLIPFLPGNNANPNGRPKKDYSITSQAKLLIDKDPEIARRIARKWLDDAIKGRTEARRDFQDRTEGKSPDILQISGPIAIVVINEDGTKA